MILTPLLLAALASVPPECSDDKGTDRCAAAEQERMRALYGVRSVEEHARAGDQLRRVFYVDGYGRDVVAITFIRRRGSDPTATVHFPRRPDEKPAPPLEAAVPHDVWAEVLRESELFDRYLAPRPQSSETVEICLHSWVYVVEANDPARANLQQSSLRRKTEDACADGPAAAFADDLQRAALPLFPHCHRLDPDQHRNAASQLAACRILAGDRLAAAEALNRTHALRRVGDPGSGDRLKGLFAHEVNIDWAGERARLGGLAAADFWARKVASAGGANHFVSRVEGLAADRARMTGFLSRTGDSQDGQETAYYRAPVELTWVYGPAQQWQIAEARVGAWEREQSD